MAMRKGVNSGRSNPESVARHKQPVKAVVTRDSISKNSESSLVRSLTVRSNNARVHHEVALKKPVKRRAFCCLFWSHFVAQETTHQWPAKCAFFHLPGRSS